MASNFRLSVERLEELRLLALRLRAVGKETGSIAVSPVELAALVDAYTPCRSASSPFFGSEVTEPKVLTAEFFDVQMSKAAVLEGLAMESGDFFLDRVIEANKKRVALELPAGAVQLLYDVLGHFPHETGSWSNDARALCAAALMDARTDA